jgi:hypothetical protein
MPVLLMLGLLLVLWAFIIWERRRPVAPLSREVMVHGWSPRALVKWPFSAGLAVCSAALGAAQWFSPSHPPFTGKLSLLSAFAYEQFGPAGIAYFWWAVAAVLACLAVVSWLATVRGRGGNHAER